MTWETISNRIPAFNNPHQVKNIQQLIHFPPMNKKTGISLSEKDRQLLAMLDRQFTIAEHYLGSEPTIYGDFNINPENENTDALQRTSKRVKIFSEHLKPKSKEA